MTTLAERAEALDAADPLAALRAEFVLPPQVSSYLDGNSLGRPLRATRARLGSFVDGDWGTGLIRSWDAGWMDAPVELGDAIARITLGAAPGQTVVADSTTVMLYKLVRGAVAARPGRDQVVADTENFPTDRFVLEGVAAECGLEIVWLRTDPRTGPSAAQVRAAAGPRTALVLLSHVSYRSGFVADMPAITAAAHDAGALMLWDLCHSVGAVELELDRIGVDLAVGCTYKYLNGGPGAPAFGYLARSLHGAVRQPVQGWMGAADPFAMAPSYVPATGIRQLISGTPPIVGMLPMRDMLDLIERAGMAAVRAKSVLLTELVIEAYDELLAPLGVELGSPRDPAARGGHVTLDHPSFQGLLGSLWERGVIPDFRPPRGLRIGLSPLSTSFAEVAHSLTVVAELLHAAAAP
ncbi:MAG: aminotransferase class V-fold PLP-dependent enzyme [Nocardioides sp.]|uniref:kynureninase n=1 Tax=Nocardioides sp. TaxID=35761 RepID=UPI0039E4AFA9